MTSPPAAPLGVEVSIDNLLAAVRDLLDSDPRTALEQAEALLPSTRDPRIFRLAAEACRRLDMTDDAADAELAAIQAGFRVSELNDAAVALQEGLRADSRAILDRFLASQPDDLLALTLAAEADIYDWALERAEERLRAVLERAPTFLRAIMLLAKSLVQQARLKEGISLIEEVIRRKPNNLTTLEYVAELHAEANDREKAAEVYARVITLAPGNLATWIVYAQELRILGRKDESVAAFRRALELDGYSGAAWWGLVNYFPWSVTDSDVATINEALKVRADTPQEAGPLNITLSLLAERGGDHAAAFAHIAEGKRLRLSTHPYDSARASADVDERIRIFDADRFEALGGAGCADDSPIFIVGMPRSGTTLLERILSGHSHIEAGGELPIMPRFHERLRRGSDAGYIERVTALAAADFTQLGQAYVDRSRDYRPLGKPRFIDKLNSNWLHVGLIRLMLPNARIIDLRRDALDCCWANFKMLFAEGSIASNDQRDIARFYQDYVGLVEAVSAASPGGILHLRYEDLVDDVEGRTREILDFLGLDFEPDCLDFHLSTTAVATPSSEQVRRPINRDSIGSADPYRQWLAPMIEELGDLAR